MDLAGKTACRVGEPVGEMVSKDQIGYGEQPLAGVPSRLGWADRPVRRRRRTRVDARNKAMGPRLPSNLLQIFDRMDDLSV